MGFGLVHDDEYEKVFSAMLGHLEQLDYHFDTGIFGTPLLLKVLTDNGRADLAYRLMNQRDFPGYSYLLDEKTVHCGKLGMVAEIREDVGIVTRCLEASWHGFIIRLRVYDRINPNRV